MRRRSNLLVLLGLVSFVLGILAVYLITGDDSDDGEAADANTVEVLVAAEDLGAGELGDDIIESGRYRVERVALNEKQADALVAPSQLSNTALTLNFTEGEQLRTSGLRSLGGARAQIPEGFEAVSVTVPFVAGGASTIIPGDRVNVFAVLSGEAASPTVTPGGEVAAPPFTAPRAELLLTNTLVLDVQQGTSPLQVSQPTDGAAGAAGAGESLIFVLAVDTVDAEKVIFTATSGQLYLSRVRVDDEGNPAPPVEGTPGVDFGTILAEEAGNAFRRSNG